MKLRPSLQIWSDKRRTSNLDLIESRQNSELSREYSCEKTVPTEGLQMSLQSNRAARRIFEHVRWSRSFEQTCNLVELAKGSERKRLKTIMFGFPPYAGINLPCNGDSTGIGLDSMAHDVVTDYW
ncbi:cell division protein SepF [Striga asiatica]|uniref:Cell division protein SepF n=1 Tax=Striga asiatica TaxID=4170 RepID=A0A5A7QPY5_STRAF|nr:cell division protein SepF [Striga asiatica]